MKLIRVIKQTTRIRESIGLFYCPYCEAEVERTLRNGERTKSCGCLQRKGGNVELDERHYLGQRCKHGCEYEGTGKTLRFKATKGCVICSRRHNRENAHKFKSAYIKHDRGEASLHCKHYQDCLAKVPGGFKMNCGSCDKFEYKHDCFRDEIRDAPFGGDTFSEHGCWTKWRSG